MNLEINPQESNVCPYSNVYDEAFVHNKYEIYEWLRNNSPVHWDEGMKSWFVTRYDDVVACAKSHIFVTSQLIPQKMETLPADEQQAFSPITNLITKWMIYNDRPVHTHIRKHMNRAFITGQVESLRPKIREITKEELNKLVASGGKVDFIKDFSHKLPALVLCTMLGIPRELVYDFIRWSDDIAAFMQDFVVSSRPNEEINLKTQASMKAIFDCLYGIIQARKEKRENDLISFLIQDNEDEFSQEDLAIQCIHLIFGGHKIPQFMIGNFLLSLLRNPVQFDKLRKTQSLLENAIEEGMRYESPIQYITRIAIEDMTLHGKNIKKGDSVYLFLGAANRDERKFFEPMIFDIERERDPHVSFGWGYHSCIAMMFVRAELYEVFQVLLEFTQKIEAEIDLNTIEWSSNPTFHGLKSFPIKITT